MSDVKERLDQARAALHVSSEMLCNHESGHMRAFQDARDKAYAALAALPSAEELAQMQREAAAFRWFQSHLNKTERGFAAPFIGSASMHAILECASEEGRHPGDLLSAVEEAAKGGQANG